MVLTHARTCAVVAYLIAYLSACTSWHTVTEPSERVIPRDRPSPVQVTTEEGKQFIQHPEIRDHTLVGTLAEGDSVSVALADVRGLEVRKTSRIRTISFVALIVAVVGFVFAAGASPSVDPGLDGG